METVKHNTKSPLRIVDDLRESLDVIQERIDEPNSKFRTSDLKGVWNSVSEAINEIESSTVAASSVEELTAKNKEYQEALMAGSKVYSRDIKKLESEIEELKKERGRYREALPNNETLAIELIARFSGNSRGNPIAKNAFVDAVQWIRKRLEAALNSPLKQGD